MGEAAQQALCGITGFHAPRGAQDLGMTAR